MALFSHTTSYAGLEGYAKRAAALQDVVDYLGWEKFVIASAAALEERPSLKKFTFLVSVGGVEGYPALAWYEHLFGEASETPAAEPAGWRPIATAPDAFDEVYFFVRPRGLHPARGVPYLPTVVTRLGDELFRSDNHLEPLVWSYNGGIHLGPTTNLNEADLEWRPLSDLEEGTVSSTPPQETPECEHEWVEGVDEDGRLVEPAYDVCVHCGVRQD